MEIFYDYIFWFLAAALIFHLLEEQLCGLQPWLHTNVKLDLTTQEFIYIQIFLLSLVVLCAVFGWLIPVLALAGASALFIDSVFFHLILGIKKRKIVPGSLSALFLCIPLSIMAYYAASKSTVSTRSFLVSLVIGFLIASYPTVILTISKKFAQPINATTKK